MVIHRRSSAFRPHDWKYPPQATTSLLELLPIAVLSSIFENLQTADLLTICVVSKYLYLPAAAELFRKIIISDDNLILEYATTKLRRWGRNFGTIVKSQNVGLLVDVLRENAKLAELVAVLVVSSPCNALDDLLNVTQIRELHTAEHFGIGETKCFDLIRRASVPLSSALPFSNLSELRILYSSTSNATAVFAELADSLVASNIQLSILNIEEFEDRDIRQLNRMNTGSELAPWIPFFETLVKLSVKLKLRALGLDGFLGHHGARVAEILARSVEIDTLESLQLCCRETSHSHSAHFDVRTTLLENLTKRTSLLTELAINPTYDCLTCQEQSIIASLENSPGLDLLLAVLESPNSASADTVKRTILLSQGKLRNLRWKENAGEDRARFSARLSPVQNSAWEHGSFYEFKLRRFIFPSMMSDLHPVQFTTDPLAMLVESGKQAMRDFLGSDLIFQSVSRLPYLERYKVLDFTLYILEIQAAEQQHE